MTPKVLTEFGFDTIIGEAAAQTQTGHELITKYQTYLMAQPVSCGVINQFVREASSCQYDSGVRSVLETVSDYINTNKTCWAIATACESISANQSQYNLLNRNAARQAEKLLEMEEDDVVRYIRAGAMKNIMFCEAFRKIAKSVFNGMTIVENTADYTKVIPVSFIESVGDGTCFAAAGKLFKMDDAANIMEAQWNEVSAKFKTIESLLESNMTSINESSIDVTFNNSLYEISENQIKNGSNTYTVEQFRDQSRLVLMTVNPRRKHEVAAIRESIALIAESYNQIAQLDHVAIYTTKADKFIVIESGANLYASLLASTHNAAWTINEDAIKACTFIKNKTNVQLSEAYDNVVARAIEEATEESRMEMEQVLENDTILSMKERISLLTEKFKNDPTKLAVLSKLASEIADI